jgi:hypothetical protein
MSDLARYERALIAADAAGDTQAATQLAQAIRQMQAPQPAPAAQDANPPGTMIGRAAMQAVKDTLEVPIRGEKAALKGTIGGLVDLVNMSPQVVNLLPGTQGVQPISQQPIFGTQHIENVFQKMGGELATAETSLGKVADFAAEIAFGSVPLTKAPSLTQKTAEIVTAAQKPVVQAAKTVASASIKTAGKVTDAVGNVVEKGVVKFKESNLTPEEKALDPAARLVIQTIKKEGLNPADAVKRIQEAREQGIEIPLYQAFRSRTLTSFAKNVSQFGPGSRIAQDSVDALKSKQIPESIAKVLDEISNIKDLGAEDQSRLVSDMASDVFDQAKAALRQKAEPLYTNLMSPKLEERAVSATAGGPTPADIAAWNKVKSYPKLEDIAKWNAAQARPAREAGTRTLVRWNQVKGIDKLLSDDIGQSLKTDLRKSPAVRDYLKKEYGLDDAAIDSMPENSLPFVDALKREIDSKTRPTVTFVTPFAKSRMLKWKDSVIKLADEQYPAYAQARKIYSDDIKYIQNLEDGALGVLKDLSDGQADLAGEKMMRLPVKAIIDLRTKFANSGLEGAQQSFEDGVVSFLKRRFDSMKDNRFQGFKNAVYGDELMRSRLRAALGAQKTQRLDTLFGVLDDALQSTRLMGSDTATNLAAQRAMQNGLDQADQAITLFQNPVRAVRQMAQEAYQKTLLDDPEGAQNLAKYLFTPEGEKLLEELAKMPKGSEKAKGVAVQALAGAGAFGASQQQLQPSENNSNLNTQKQSGFY